MLKQQYSVNNHIIAGDVLLLLIIQSHVHVVAMESNDSFKPPLM